MDKVQNKNAVAYIRISSQRQINNESPATQREAIQRYADANGISIVRWFEDIAKSGKNAEREGLQQLLEYCIHHKGELSYWIVYNMRRASRDIESYTTIIKSALKARGISVRSATEPAIDDSKEGRFLETLFVALGQLDNEGKAEVTVDNMRAQTLQGYWLNAPMVGYDSCKIPNALGQLRASLKPNSMAPKVKLVLERFSEGNISKAELTRYAKEVGLRSRYGKVLPKDRIHKLLKQPIYTGFISNNFTSYELVPGKHPAIISEDTYRRNQEYLFGKNSRKGETHLKINEHYPLKGLILCSNCAKSLYASAPKTGNGSHSPRYHCARKECIGTVRSIKAQVVHDDFERMLNKIKPSEGVLRLYKAILIREANKRLGQLNNSISTLRNEISQINSSRVNAIQKFADGEINNDEKNILIDHLDTQKAVKSSELSDLENQQSVREADIETAIRLMENVSEQWANSALDLKVRFQKMLFPEGLIYDYSSGLFGTSSISPLYRLISTKKDLPETEKSFLVAQVHSNWNLLVAELGRWKGLSGNFALSGGNTKAEYN